MVRTLNDNSLGALSSSDESDRAIVAQLAADEPMLSPVQPRPAPVGYPFEERC